MEANGSADDQTSTYSGTGGDVPRDLLIREDPWGAFRPANTATEEKVITDSLCKLHGLFAPEHATQININLDRTVEQLEKLPDSELLKIAGTDNQYLMPKKDGNKKD
mgnify:CR=1 FL=1